MSGFTGRTEHLARLDALLTAAAGAEAPRAVALTGGQPTPAVRRVVGQYQVSGMVGGVVPRVEPAGLRQPPGQEPVQVLQR